MSYRRRSPWSPYGQESYSSITKVSIHWSNKSSAYAIKFADTKNWTQMQILIGYLKNIPWGERDYDPVEKVWYLVEKHLDAFRSMVEALKTYFELDFISKPENQTNTHTFVSVEVYLDKFKTLTGMNIVGLDYDFAKKIYRKACLQNHPDRGGDPKKMSDINECWSALEINHFKIKKEMENVS